MQGERQKPEVLEYEIRAEVQKYLRPRHLKNADDLIEELTAGIMDKVPSQAFESDERYAHQEGVLTYMGNVTRERCESAQLEMLSAHYSLPKSKPLTLMLTSNGGSCAYGLGVTGVMNKIQADGRPIHVHIMGAAMSMGSIIAQAAARRYIDESATMMLHEIEYSMRGKIREHEDYLGGAQRDLDSLVRIYAERTGRPEEYWHDRIRRRDVFLTAEEALAENLVDEIVRNPYKGYLASAGKLDG